MSTQHIDARGDVETEFGKGSGVDTLGLMTALARHWKLLVAAPIVLGLAAAGLCTFVPPTFTAKTVFVPPQQSQSSATASAMASLGALASLAGGGIKTPGDQYVALLQSVNVSDKLVDRFKLQALYEVEYRVQARQALARDTRIQLGKKDGLITVEVDASTAQLAADIANAYVMELRRLSSDLALTEAQQRRAFFEGELKNTHTRLAKAQSQLQAGGFSPGALKAEPKAAAEAYARVKAEVTGAEVKLQTLRQSRADSATEVQQQLATVTALRAQLAQLATKNDSLDDAEYLDRYREFKYQETLYELFSRQYELARIDESREGVNLQIVDVATPPERKSKPRRSVAALITALVSFAALVAVILGRHALADARRDPVFAERLQAFGRAWKGRKA